MLHEVLLALSGHRSPLFTEPSSTHIQDDESLLLSPSEKALLQSIGRLSDLHCKLRQHVAYIASKHKSMICRAVAVSIQQTHLSRFQKKIIDVENNILTKDASLVGAYDIVPLAGVVGEFDDWHRRMAWYWDIACYMEHPQSMPAALEVSKGCKGAALIDKLRAEQQTGFPDIAYAAVELSQVAETAWLRQLSSWILYGKIPSFGADDFFIRAIAGESIHFTKQNDLLPRFVNPSTASSILFVGKSLHQVRKYGRHVERSKGPSQPMSEKELASAHLKQLSSLTLPILSGQFSRTMTTIRQSLSQNILQHLLPMEMTLDLLLCLKQFFLLGRGDFAFLLINAAESRLEARQKSMGKLLQQDPVKALQGLAIKDVEMNQTLLQTFKAIASQEGDGLDHIFEFARKHVSLSSPSTKASRPSSSEGFLSSSADPAPIAFNDLLFPTATSLSLELPAPFDLFISSREIDIYSTINSYLLSIERGYLRLSDLWKRTPARRDHPTWTFSTPEMRERLTRRRIATRKIWATCSAAIFLLSETARFFEGEIIKESWDHFERWVKEPMVDEHSDQSDRFASTSSERRTQRDPETLASGHRTFLASLTYALLLNDVACARELRSLLGNVDNLIASFNSLLDVQQKLDLEYDAGGETGYSLGEEQRVSLELDRARKKVDSDLKSVVNRLRQLDQERIGSARFLDVGPSASGFEAWKGGGVDQLLMKLEFGRMTEAGLI